MKKIYFIIGPTSSGKTALSIELARKIGNSEIISADSRQIYRDFNLSSGKVTVDEMENIPHHMLDIVNPGDYFSVVDFVDLSLQKIEKIHERGNNPIICGGTGLYIDSLLFDYQLPDVKNNDTLREELKTKSTEALFKILTTKLFQLKNLKYFLLNIATYRKFATPEYRGNPHRLMRAIEIVSVLGYIPKLKKIDRFDKNIYDIEIINIKIERNILRDKIYKRLIERIEQGMIEEIRSVKDKYYLTYGYLEKLGLEFKWTAKYLQDKISKEEMIAGLYTEICQYAKRQDTWFRRY